MMATLVLRPAHRAMERMRFEYSCRLVKEKAKALALRADTSESAIETTLQFSHNKMVFEGVTIDGIERVTLDGRPVKKEALAVFPRTGFTHHQLVIEGPKRVSIEL